MTKLLRLIVIGAVLLGGASAAVAQAPLEQQVKASYIYNFIRFSTWPDDVFTPNGKFNLCIIGAERFGSTLDDIQGERVDGHEVSLHRLAAVEDVRPGRCHALFIPSNVQAPALAPERGRLTIGETPGFLKQGGIINLVESGGRIRFEINQQAAREAGLVLSSRLLNLAVRLP